ncbi:MAG: response regulator [Gammaproteobacteria bacterium]|nr:response regulator [Gammaproteobacteria bacterium]
MNNADTIIQEQTFSESLLFVDDEESILSSLKRLFRPLGYRIFTAQSGAEGLDIMKKEEIDLVVSDMRMPEMDGAQFLENVAANWPKTVRILLTGYADITSTVAAINKGKIYSYFSKPWEDNDIALSIRHALNVKDLEEERDGLLEMILVKNEKLKELNESLEDKVEQRTAELKQAFLKLEKSHESLKMGYFATVKSFSSLIEMREGAVAGYSRRIADQARKLALKMEMSNADVQDVLYASLLHDIGKIGMPDHLFNKPFNALSPEDKVTVCKHPVIGQGVMMAWGSLEGVARIIRSHRECYDGYGYPDSLKGIEIPLGARILSVVSDFEALRIGKLASQKYSALEAQEYLIRHRGKRYDPDVVDAFLNMDSSHQPTPQNQELKISLKSLVPGMVLSKDVMLKDGVLLLSEGRILDKRNIEELRDMEKSLNENLDIHVLMKG